MVNAAPWLDASKAHILANCPMRWIAETTAEPHSKERRTAESGWSAATLGIQAHQALEQWALSSEWREDDSGALLRERFRALADSNTNGVGAARIIGSKLTARGRELAQRLRASNCGQLLAEELVNDDDRRIRGGMDLVAVSGSRVQVFDLKTGSGYARNRPLPESAKLQLAVYSVLAARRWNRPVTVSILSLDGGLIDAEELTPDAAELLVRALEERRATAVATPGPFAVASPGVCKWCVLRLFCKAHWVAVDAGVITDAVAGEVERSSVSANGQASVILRTSEGRQLVAGLAEPPTFAAGALIAALRVRRVDDTPNMWRANASSALGLMEV